MKAADPNSGLTGVKEKAAETNQLVETLWNQYEQSLDTLRKFSESREDAYLNAVKEMIKFNQEFRGSLANLYQTSKEANEQLVKGISSNLGKKSEDKEGLPPELTEQFEELSDRLKHVVALPLIAGLELIGNMESKAEENSENYVNYVRERREEWQKVTDQYMKEARNSHQKLAKRVEESLKLFTGSN